MKQVAYLAFIAATAFLAVSSPVGASPATKDAEAGNKGKSIGDSAGALADSIAKHDAGKIAQNAVALAGSIVDSASGKGKKEAREAVVAPVLKSEAI
ncbi:hypothetical protein MAC_08473 [Metarhizium acridum CQMa 102]|uniref:Uncharacterized protein n=1 Tax=Metarhizium acridum (strain CQMa 102) TaxID=655827 RepID=E9EF25_METAQ|nr:uncharacterized protein MAC_08473 [Metarhizium acridum CQMa 102]EFY85470.1 hypothetical protein MAC_08473 [Metarhizium acridum CQMa 102]